MHNIHSDPMNYRKKKEADTHQNSQSSANGNLLKAFQDHAYFSTIK